MTIRVCLAVVLCVVITTWSEARAGARLRVPAGVAGAAGAAGTGAPPPAVSGAAGAEEKTQAAKGTTAKPASGGASGEAGALNVNSASAEQLEALPGIGAAMATRIIEYRQKHGPFKRLDDLMNVRGIGEKNFLKLKPLITIGAVKPDRESSER